METLIVEPKSRKQLNAIKAVLKALDIPFRQEQESPYNPEFVARIKKVNSRSKKVKLPVLQKKIYKASWEQNELTVAIPRIRWLNDNWISKSI